MQLVFAIATVIATMVLYPPNLSADEPKPGSLTIDGRMFLYRDRVEGWPVYWDDWYGVRVRRQSSGLYAYIQGEGKSGDFDGILEIRCNQPPWNSHHWIAGAFYGEYPADDNLYSYERVPPEVIAQSTRLFCPCVECGGSSE